MWTCNCACPSIAITQLVNRPSSSSSTFETVVQLLGRGYQFSPARSWAMMAQGRVLMSFREPSEINSVDPSGGPLDDIHGILEEDSERAIIWPAT